MAKADAEGAEKLDQGVGGEPFPGRAVKAVGQGAAGAPLGRAVAHPVDPDDAIALDPAGKGAAFLAIMLDRGGEAQQIIPQHRPAPDVHMGMIPGNLRGR